MHVIGYSALVDMQSCKGIGKQKRGQIHSISQSAYEPYRRRGPRVVGI